MKNFGTNLPQLDLTWANLFGPSCEYINLWQQQQWETCVISNTQICSSCLPQFDSIWRWQHATCQQQQSNKKSYRTHNLLMTYKSRAVHWLALPLTPSLSPSISLLSAPSLKCCQTASETLDEHLPHTWLTCQAAHSMWLYVCVCECDCDCELAYTPLHTWVGTVAEKS